MGNYAHYVINDNYLHGEKVFTNVKFWVFPNKFEDDEVNYSLCTGHKEFNIYHKLKAGFYDSFDCEKCHFLRNDQFCIDDICFLVKKLYPDYDFFGSKDYFIKHFRRKKCVDVEERCQKEKNPVKR